VQFVSTKGKNRPAFVFSSQPRGLVLDGYGECGPIAARVRSIEPRLFLLLLSSWSLHQVAQLQVVLRSGGGHGRGWRGNFEPLLLLPILGGIGLYQRLGLYLLLWWRILVWEEVEEGIISIISLVISC
jgi:hypothetical protein